MFDEKGTTKQNLAACAAARAVALTTRQEFFVLPGVYARHEKPPDFAGGLSKPKAKASDW
jgi:hypothetical protein